MNHRPLSRSFARTSILVMLAFFLTKLTGQIRQILMGVQFGYDTPYSDALTQGFLIPDFAYMLLVGGAIQAAIVPFLSSSIEKGREREGWKAVSTLIVTLAWIMVVFLALCGVFCSEIMRHFTSEASFPIAVRAARVLLPQAFFMMLAGILIGILNTYKQFVATALTPCLYNILLLFSLVLWGGRSDAAVVITSVGFTASAICYFLFQVWVARRKLHLFQPNLQWSNPEAKLLLRLALPTLVSSALPYFSSFLISSFYPLFPDGTSYAYSNAVSIWQLPYGIIVIALTNMLLPDLSSAIARGDHRAAVQKYSQNFRLAMLLIVPAALCFLVMREDVVEAVLRWNHGMTRESIQYTASILTFYCFVLLSQTVAGFLNLLYYAYQKTWIPMLCSCVCQILLYLFSLLLVSYTQLGAPSMAAGFACASLCAVLLLLLLRKIILPAFHVRGNLRFAATLLFCTLFALLVLAFWQWGTQGWQPSGKLAQVFYLGLRTVGVYSFFLCGSWALGVPEVEFLFRIVSQKWKR